MDATLTCKSCGATLPPEAPEGLCPKCLLKAGFGTAGGPGAFTPLGVNEVAQLFPSLEVLELLGKGGMGAVYKARQRALDRVVALKILPPHAGSDPGFAERFAREARALAKLSHPNIVALYDFGQVRLANAPAGESAAPIPEAADTVLNYFLMEYVDGASLRQLEQAGKLSPREALHLIPQICEALQFAHDEGVVHRDIKPENVLVDKRGRVKIADFGLAKILGLEPKDVRLTGVRDVMGTPHYMAPEQLEHPQAVDHRADIYSLGVVFYEMLTGELPLGKFPLPSRKVQVDVRLDEVVLHALEKEPERRYQHANQVKTDVQAISQSPLRLVETAAIETGSARSTIQPRHSRRAVLAAAMVGAILLLLASAVTLGLRGKLDTRDTRQPNLVVEGTVLDVTGQPIKGARVADNYYGTRQARPAQEAWTDSSGHYELVTWDEEHTLAVSAPAHQTALRTLLRPPRAAARVQMDFRLQLAPGAPLPMPPVVLKTVPPAGATDVDPGLSELQVVFSATMLDQSWSWTTWGDGTFPEVTGKIHYLQDGCTCVLPVKLEPGRFYATWLNSGRFHNFQDQQGRPAVPYLLVFQTRKGPL